MKCPNCAPEVVRLEAVLQGHDKKDGVVVGGKVKEVPVTVVTCADCRRILAILNR